MKLHVGDKVKAIDKRITATYNRIGVIRSFDKSGTKKIHSAMVEFEGIDPTYDEVPFIRLVLLEYLEKVL